MDLGNSSHIWSIFLAYARNFQLLFIFAAHLSDLEDLPVVLPFFFFVPVFSGNYYRKKPHLLILTLDSLAFLRRKRCLFFPGSISITPWQWPELWIFKYFLRLSSSVSPSPASSTFSLPAFGVQQHDRCSCWVCRSWCAAVSCLQHWGCARPELSTLGSVSPFPQGWLPCSFGGECVRMLCLHGIPLYLLLFSINAKESEVFGFFLSSSRDFLVSFPSLRIPQRVWVEIRVCYFGPDSLSFIKTRQILTKLMYAPWGVFFFFPVTVL